MLIPERLNFVKGVVDLGVLPLNISRETLQQNKIVRVLKKIIVKNCLKTFAETAKEKVDHTKFPEQFGKCLNLCDCDEGYELVLQGCVSVCVAKDVEYKTDEVSEKSPDCMVCSSASGSQRQRHNCGQQRKPGQVAQERVSGKRKGERRERK